MSAGTCDPPLMTFDIDTVKLGVFRFTLILHKRYFYFAGVCFTESDLRVSSILECAGPGAVLKIQSKGIRARPLDLDQIRSFRYKCFCLFKKKLK